MPSFILLPDGVTGTNEWLTNFGGTAAATDVDNDNDDIQHISENTHGHEITFTMANSPVSSAEISSITDVQIKFKARGTGTRNESVIVSQTGGIGINTISNGTDTITVVPGGVNDYTLYSGTAETTYNGLSPWNKNLSQLNVLQVKLDKFRNSALWAQLRISYLYVVVNYLPTVHVNGIENADLAKINGIPMSEITKVNGV